MRFPNIDLAIFLLPAALAMPTSSPRAAPAAIPPSASHIKHKRGIIMPLDDSNTNDKTYYVKAFTHESTPKIKWTANFWSGRPEGLDASIHYIPQRYNVAPDQYWVQNAETAIENGTGHFFSFGEPGLTATVPFDGQIGANYWKQEMQNWTSEALVGAPCMLTSEQDFVWLEDFLAKCTGCPIGFIAIHWINTLDAGGAPSSITNFKQIVARAIGIAQKLNPPVKVWVDNIQASGAYEDTTAFLSGIIPYLEHTEEVERYAYFGPTSGDPSSLLNADGTISQLGRFFADFDS
ncbi:hypothetical protein LTR09_007705 [Extremus antarcticus]|uniref:Asl1-like glycosyl hydrolase catalytic domain-containing protein n=1 Tax=Extremus antarcticus TaxID=702011 RepID=A0AAJ0GAP1_9PEZI|nr:hypothetical protein LTR09_007705 [Extremus antarcticus]